MSRVVVTNYLTLDGVMQAPGHPEEDRRGGFAHGGWHPPYADSVMGEVMAEGIARGESLLFGRLTYEKMAAYWPFQPEHDPYAVVMNGRQKYVASRTLADPLPWANCTVLKGGVATAVAELKKQPGGDVAVLGSGELTQLLLHTAPHDGRRRGCAIPRPCVDPMVARRPVEHVTRPEHEPAMAAHRSRG